jgi:hypothetical protein
MSPELRSAILRTTHSLLAPNGAFLVYQFTRTVLPYLQEVFGSVDQDFEPLNVMPARLFYCRHHVEHPSQHNGRGTNGAGRPMSRRPVAPDPTGNARSARSSG